ncbi:alpha-ribazole phosphatase [Anaerotignum sp.]
MKLYFVRHGETDMNARNMFYGWTDADINAKGISQAEELREAFRDIPIDAIYSSDLKRALHTAQIIADGRPVEAISDIRELYYGKWENRTWEQMTEADRVDWQKWKTDWVERVMPEGESFMDFYNRVTAGLDRIIRENKGKHVLVVSHNGALSAMHCHLTGAGPKGFWNFNSKQGHYSAVWVSEKKLTYDCINYPLCKEKTENVYVDMDSRPDDGLAYMIHKSGRDCNTIWTGTSVEAHHEKTEHVEFLKKYLDFILLEKDEPCPNWYAVPALSVFAKDSKGGYFAKRDGGSCVYHVSSDGQVTYLAEHFRKYLQMMIFERENEELQKFAEEIGLKKSETDLKRFVCPAYDIQLFVNRAEAEKQFHIHELREFMEIEPPKRIYFDSEKLGKAPEIEGYDVSPAGKGFTPFVMTCEENGFTSLQRKRGIFLIFEGNIPKLDFYPVPKLTLFAYDGEGGYFAHGGKDLDSPIYFISKELECWALAGDFRTFVQMVVFEPEWKEKITGEKVDLQETEAETEAFGMLFGLSAPEGKLSEKIHREPYYKIFDTIEKAREKMCIL